MQMIQPVQSPNYFSLVNGNQPPPIITVSQELIDYTISPTNIVLFHGRHYLNSLYRSPMVIENFEYPSVEHYYQACKLYTLAGSENARRMSRVVDPPQCKSTARSILDGLNVRKQQVDSWRRTEAPEILVIANLNKFAQNPELRQKLLATGDALLVHAFEKDDLYAVGMSEETTKKWATANDGKNIKVPRYFYRDWFLQPHRLPSYNVRGRNILGVILMMIREAFRPERGRADPRLVGLLNDMRSPRRF